MLISVGCKKHMKKQKAYEMAKNIAEYIGTNNPFKIAESLGINIEYRKYSRDIKGYCTRVFNKAYIILNENYGKRSQRIICAHELGHVLLHSGELGVVYSKAYREDDIEKIEYEANMFAASLLFDDSEMLCSINELDNYTIKNIFKSNFGFMG